MYYRMYCCKYYAHTHCRFIVPMSIWLPTTAAYPDRITWAGFIGHNLVPATIGE